MRAEARGRARTGRGVETAAVPACSGGVHLRVLPDADVEISPLSLASIIGEQEADGSRVEIVTLAVRERPHAWLAGAIEWLREHGRAVVVRTRVTLEREAVELAGRASGVTFAIEIAHVDPQIQRAALGASAASAHDLLVQTQHLRALGRPVVARVGPILPGVHDLRGFGRILAAVAAADIDRMELAFGPLGGDRLEAVRRALRGGAQLEIARAFSVAPFARFDPASSYRLDRWAEISVRHAFEGLAAQRGVELETCACIGACQSPRHYVSVLGPDLFAG